MRVLLVSPEVPWPQDQGGRIATFQLYVRGLPELGHEVDAVFAMQEGQERHEESLSPYIHRLRYVQQRWGFAHSVWRAIWSASTGVPYANLKFTPVGMSKVVRDLVRAHPYDVVIADHQHVAAAVVGLQGPKTVVHFHNVNSHLYSRTAVPAGFSFKGLHSRLQARLSARFERSIGRLVHGAFAASEDDRRRLQRVGFTAPVWLAPFGIDTEHFKPGVPPWKWPRADSTVDLHPLVVVTGSMDYYPNVDGACFLIEHVMPAVWDRLPQVRVAIVGRDPAAAVRALARDPRVLVTGTVADVRPYLAAATVVSVVLRTGGGVRIKALEAAAMARPIVGTSVGLEGLAFTQGRDAEIADDPAALASAMLGVMRDGERQETLGSAARRLVEAQYDWGHCVARLGAALDALHASAAGT